MHHIHHYGVHLATPQADKTLVVVNHTPSLFSDFKKATSARRYATIVLSLCCKMLDSVRSQIRSPVSLTPAMRISARGYCIPIYVGFIALFSFTSSHSAAQTRDEMVREDRKKIMEEGFWIYNDLPKAFTKAKQSGKPLLVVLRCIPCHECVKLDDELVTKTPSFAPYWMSLSVPVKFQPMDLTSNFFNTTPTSRSLFSSLMLMELCTAGLALVPIAPTGWETYPLKA